MIINVDDAEWAAMMDRLKKTREALDSGIYRGRVLTYGTTAAKALLASWEDWDNINKE